ncbi:MAG: helix-turn-helix transcriptional regulator [Myxococcota bacterium]
MAASDHISGLFPALLKHWRAQRGLSQLDLAMAADVSARHVSFLETGRSVPSAEMILRLATTLDVPLRHANAMLRSVGCEAVYPESNGPLAPEVAQALQMMKDHHEPFPLVVVDRLYDVVDLNGGAQALFAALLGSLTAAIPPPWNLLRLTFDERLRPAFCNFDELGPAVLWRLQREVLADPNDAPLRALMEEVSAMPNVDERWRKVDLSVPSSPAIGVHLRIGELDLRFLTMVTALQAPQTVRLDELRIETWFPSDEATAEACGAFGA